MLLSILLDDNTLDLPHTTASFQLCLTHTSYRTNYGTNPDHTRNSLTNCGMRQVDYGDRRIHYQNTRKRGICILVDIMSRMGKQEETASGRFGLISTESRHLKFIQNAHCIFPTSYTQGIRRQYCNSFSDIYTF